MRLNRWFFISDKFFIKSIFIATFLMMLLDMFTRADIRGCSLFHICIYLFCTRFKPSYGTIFRFFVLVADWFWFLAILLIFYWNMYSAHCFIVFFDMYKTSLNIPITFSDQLIAEFTIHLRAGPHMCIADKVWRGR